MYLGVPAAGMNLGAPAARTLPPPEDALPSAPPAHSVTPPEDGIPSAPPAHYSSEAREYALSASVRK